MKSVIAPKTNFIEVYVTAVPEISTAIGIKDTNPPGPSFLFNPMKKFSDEARYGSLSDKWGITAFMDRKTPGGDDVMRYLFGGSTYPCDEVLIWGKHLPLEDHDYPKPH